MTIPSENRKIMKSLGRESHFNYDRPALIPPRVNLTSYLGARTVLDNQTAFKVLWGTTAEDLFGKGSAKFTLYVFQLLSFCDLWLILHQVWRQPAAF